MKEYMYNTKLIEVECDNCGCISKKPLSEYNRNIKLSRHNFCSRRCVAIFRNKLRKGMCSSLQYEHLLKICGNRRDQYSPFRYILGNIRRRFKDYDIDLEYLKLLWESQEGICPYTGLKLVLPSYHNNVEYFKLASLDRIDSSKGYVKGNLQYISLPINFMKNTKSDKDVKQFLKQISSYTSHFCEDETISSS